MHARTRLAIAGVGTTLALGVIAGTASAASHDKPATPARPAVSPDFTACSWTISGPTLIYSHPDFNSHPLAGKHSGNVVTSPIECGTYYDNGFTYVNMSSGKVGWVYAGNIVHPKPTPPTRSRYLVTGTVNIRTAPSTVRGAVIRQKHKGDVVTSPGYKNNFYSNGFAPINLGNGDVGWISSAFLQ